MKLIRSVTALGLVLGATAFVPADAEAALILQLTQGGSVVTVTDNTAGDFNAALGAVTFIGSVGTYEVNVSTALSDPIFGSLTDPHMDLSSVNATTTGGTLIVEAIDDGFTALPGSFVMSFGGTTNNGGTVLYQTFADDGGGEVLIGSLGPFGGPAYSGATSGSAAVGTPYTLIQRVTINHPSAGNSSFDAELIAPEPASIALLGLGLLGVGIGARRRNRA